MTASIPVPDEGGLHIGTVRLPACRLLWSDHATGEPVAWITRAPVPEPGSAWSALSALHGETGLVPVLEPAGWGDNLEAACGEDRTGATDVDRVDAAAMLEHRWIDCQPMTPQTDPGWMEEREWMDDMTAPFTSQFPGLAPPGGAPLPPDVLETGLRSVPACRIALVRADRPADVIAVLGWCPGNWNCAFPAASPVAFAAVLRSWEERFGARLFAMSYDEAWLLVERPPRGLDAALPVAAEHFVFCDEPAGRQPVRATAAEIDGAPIWHFWWD